MFKVSSKAMEMAATWLREQAADQRFAGDFRPDHIVSLAKLLQQGAADLRPDVGLNEICRLLKSWVTAWSEGVIVGNEKGRDDIWLIENLVEPSNAALRASEVHEQANASTKCLCPTFPNHQPWCPAAPPAPGAEQQPSAAGQETDERIRCMECGKSVSSPVPKGTIIRARVECPECIEKNGIYMRNASAKPAETGVAGIEEMVKKISCTTWPVGVTNQAYMAGFAYMKNKSIEILRASLAAIGESPK